MTPPAASRPLSAAHLRIDGVSFSFAERRVLTDVSFTVPAAEPTGLIGENGSGKTTLLRVIAGLLTPDAGSVTATAPGGGHPRSGLLHQEPPFAPEESVADALESAVAEARAAAAEVTDAAVRFAETPDDDAAATAYAAALDAAERLSAWEVDARIGAMLAGLGIADLLRHRLTRTLSGGQRSRLSLAWLLLSAPDVLLLDEPTNHLDDDATAHLVAVLRAWPGPVLLASHDRAFLDETVTSLVDLDPSALPHALSGPLVGDGDGSGIGVNRFTGAYTGYLQARREARARWERRFREEQEELATRRSAVRDSHTVGHADWKPRSEVRGAAKFYADRNAKAVSRRVVDARSRLEDLEERQVRKPARELRFASLAGVGTEARGSGPVISASEAAVAGRLDPTSLTVSAGERWLVNGPNGSGKSTLLRLLAGDLAPTSGTVSGGGLGIRLLAQDVDLPDPRHRGPGRTTRQAYEDLVGAGRAADVPLGAHGLIAGRDENRPVAVLSVGQQRRLALAVLLADPPDVLLLDEPTNHLSLLLVTEIEAALDDYPGTVVVASHDRWLRRGWTGQSLHLGLAAPR